ncbi:MAG: hypothetical protein AB1778_04710, partial [Candidatus Bipolaricaulota bacterium]
MPGLPRLLMLALPAILGCAEPHKAPPEPVDVLSLDAHAPWKVWTDDGRREDCPTRCIDGETWLTPRVELGATLRKKCILRLDLADVPEARGRPGLDGRAPVDVVDFELTVRFPSGITPDHTVWAKDACTGYGLFHVDADWGWHEPGGWANIAPGPATTVRVSKGGHQLRDVTAIGLYVSQNDKAPPAFSFNGEVPVKVERLTVRLGPRPAPQLPERGPSRLELLDEKRWRVAPAYGGGGGVALNTSGAICLGCDLDSSLPAKRSAVFRYDLEKPRAMEREGVFLTVEVPEELV